MSETKINSSKVFVPIEISDELPEKRGAQFCINPNIGGMCKKDILVFHDYNKTWQDPFTPDESHPSHWLKEKELYCFSKEELEKLLENVFEAGGNHRTYFLTPTSFPEAPNKTTYINDLLK